MAVKNTSKTSFSGMYTSTTRNPEKPNQLSRTPKNFSRENYWLKEIQDQVYNDVKRHFEDLVFKTVIQRNVKLSEAPSHGLAVVQYDADAKGSRNYLSLAKEILSKNS